MNAKETIPAISIASIPHGHQRYETCGDWKETPGRLEILVSRMGNKDYEFCVALHELVEAYLCQKRGITDSQVTAFDVWFENDRKAGAHTETEEPGDHPLAPYRKEHFTATTIERIMAEQLQIDWKIYEETINAL